MIHSLKVLGLLLFINLRAVNAISPTQVKPRDLKLRMCEHLGLSPKTGKEYKYTTQPSTVRRHSHDE